MKKGTGRGSLGSVFLSVFTKFNVEHKRISDVWVLSFNLSHNDVII